jgi:RNA polymerase sigma-70 factor, ECF subfamily
VTDGLTDWKAILDQWGQLVWSTVYRLVGQHADASDCFQETFLEAVRVANRQSVDNWPALLRHLATARALDLLRVRYRTRGRIEPLADLDAVVGPAASPPEEAMAEELAERLREALVHLPAQQAEVFCLSCMEHWTHGEIAQRLRLTPNAVGVLLHRARQQLRKLLVPVAVRPAPDDRGWMS